MQPPCQLPKFRSPMSECGLPTVHAGSTGFSSAGFSINSGRLVSEVSLGPSGSEGKSGPAVFAPTPDNRWGVFLTGLGEFTNVYSTPEAAGYDVNTGGFTFGVDYRLTPNIAIGLTGGYAHTNINLDWRGKHRRQWWKARRLCHDLWERFLLGYRGDRRSERISNAPDCAPGHRDWKHRWSGLQCHGCRRLRLDKGQPEHRTYRQLPI